MLEIFWNKPSIFKMHFSPLVEFLGTSRWSFVNKGYSGGSGLSQVVFQVHPWRMPHNSIKLRCSGGHSLLQAPLFAAFQGERQLQPPHKVRLDEADSWSYKRSWILKLLTFFFFYGPCICQKLLLKLQQRVFFLGLHPFLFKVTQMLPWWEKELVALHSAMIWWSGLDPFFDWITWATSYLQQVRFVIQRRSRKGYTGENFGTVLWRM